MVCLDSHDAGGFKLFRLEGRSVKNRGKAVVDLGPLAFSKKMAKSLWKKYSFLMGHTYIIIYHLHSWCIVYWSYCNYFFR